MPWYEVYNVISMGIVLLRSIDREYGSERQDIYGYSVQSVVVVEYQSAL